MDLSTPPPDLYGRPRADRFFERLTAFSDWYTPAMGRPGLRRNPRRPQTRPTPPLTVVVTSHEPIAADVVELRLADPSGAPLPGWQPGARILLTLPSGRERHYSLCGDPADRHFYRIAVRRIADGGGGSTEVHDELHAGVRLTVRRPRNGFAFCGEPRVLLLAGGIGITPLLPMARAARRAGVDWRLVHTGRDAASLPFTDELRALDPTRVEIRTDDVHGVPDAADLLSRAPQGAAVYACGPAPMLSAVQRALDASPAASLHVERFGAPPIVDGRPFTIRLGADGPELTVPADRSALDVARELRPDLPYSCHQGFCGTCRLTVRSGTPEHRDRRLTEDERAAGALLPCVSRAAEGETLVLEV
ncbi:PDR/VanB family oxidoreductase [Kitasatospora paracochleata]|uniref:Ferredoxin-NADP reductase n=1 Tax=Kitasatospora paracochleata TaxID=58354 RepID=A0ABT1IUH5_9ACTN|nr:PDR/VanB family oxidoreductase [Kitasatospora paracochleata]MCP2308536.1 ferredoxin-NADP reductase [Kitasatospora paracochleata]